MIFIWVQNDQFEKKLRNPFSARVFIYRHPIELKISIKLVEILMLSKMLRNSFAKWLRQLSLGNLNANNYRMAAYYLWHKWLRYITSSNNNRIMSHVFRRKSKTSVKQLTFNNDWFTKRGKPVFHFRKDWNDWNYFSCFFYFFI